MEARGCGGLVSASPSRRPLDGVERLCYGVRLFFGAFVGFGLWWHEMRVMVWGSYTEYGEDYLHTARGIQVGLTICTGYCVQSIYI
jgi:hypothetical protein